MPCCPTGWLQAFRFEWVHTIRDSLTYLPIVIPFALATVVGGIDCTESAAAAGDEFDTNRVIAVEAFATLVASLCGGVIQTTPYIGHPAYKAMGRTSCLYSRNIAAVCRRGRCVGILWLPLLDYPQANRISHLDLHRTRDHVAEFSGDAQEALPSGRFGMFTCHRSVGRGLYRQTDGRDERPRSFFERGTIGVAA